MEQNLTHLPRSKVEPKVSGGPPAHPEAEAIKQRRKVQNRRNQRAHRLRVKGKDAAALQRVRPFKIARWRLNEQDDDLPEPTSQATESASITQIPARQPYAYTGPSLPTAERTISFESLATTSTHLSPASTPWSFTLPLSSDHLLHLIQYNVLRALIMNKHKLFTLPSDPTSCPMTGPCGEKMTPQSLKPNIPPSLVPTPLQRKHYHATWINGIPFPRIRDNLIQQEGRYDQWDLGQDLIGEFINSKPATPNTATASGTRRALPGLSSWSDPDEFTAGRMGLIVWGEPHEAQSWEATPGFLAKWTWAVDGCEELIEISNRWRMKRGEKPMRLPLSLSCPPQPLLLAASNAG